MKIPKSLEEYLAWAIDNIASDFSDPISKNLYEANLTNYFNATSEQAFFRGFVGELEKFNSEYKINNNSSELLMEGTRSQSS